jgi:DNA processing protein
VDAIQDLGADRTARMLLTVIAALMVELDPDAVRTAVLSTLRFSPRLIVPGEPEWPTQLDDLGDARPPEFDANRTLIVR